MSELQALKQVIQTRQELIAIHKEKFDYHAHKAQQAQKKLEALWCENEKDNARINHLKIQMQ